MSDVYQSLAHSKWDCKYHVVFVPKRRRKAIFGHHNCPAKEGPAAGKFFSC
jgi:REP element-mobilizing transposase RayT